MRSELPKNLTKLAVGALALAAFAAVPALAQDSSNNAPKAEKSTKATASKAKSGAKPGKLDPATLKVTGKTVDCLPMMNVRTTRPVGLKTIMFSTIGGQWYRNDLKTECAALGHLGQTLVFRNITTGQYCSIDMFSVVDMVSGVNYGTCSLGSFTPVQAPANAQF